MPTHTSVQSTGSRTGKTPSKQSAGQRSIASWVYAVLVSLFGLLVYGAGVIGVILQQTGTGWPMWPATGVATAGLLVGGLRWAPGIFLGVLALGPVIPADPPVAILWAAVTTLEAVALTLAIRITCDHDGPPLRRQDVTRFCVGIAPLVTFAFACATTAAASFGGTLPAGGHATYLVHAWLSDLTAVLVIPLATLSLLQAPEARGMNVLRLVEGGGIAIALIFIAHYTLPGHAYGYLLISLPLVVIGGVRLGPQGAGISVSMVTALLGFNAYAVSDSGSLSSIVLDAGAIASLAFIGFQSGSVKVSRTQDAPLHPFQRRRTGRYDDATTPLFEVDLTGSNPFVVFMSSGVFGLLRSHDIEDPATARRAAEAALADTIRRLEEAQPEGHRPVTRVDTCLSNCGPSSDRALRIVATRESQKDASSITWRGVMLDDTSQQNERDRHQKELERAHRELLQAGSAHFRWDRLTGSCADSDELSSLLGLTEEEERRPWAAWMQRTEEPHPTSVRQALSSLVRYHHPIVMQCLVRRPERDPLWIDVRVEGEWNARGRLIAIEGYVRDVHNEISAERRCIELSRAARQEQTLRTIGTSAIKSSEELAHLLKTLRDHTSKLTDELEYQRDPITAELIDQYVQEVETTTSRVNSLCARIIRWRAVASPAESADDALLMISDPTTRDQVRAVLSDLGYRVRPIIDESRAIAWQRQSNTAHLLVADENTGRLLARTLRIRDEHLGVVLIHPTPTDGERMTITVKDGAVVVPSPVDPIGLADAIKAVQQSSQWTGSSRHVAPTQPV